MRRGAESGGTGATSKVFKVIARRKVRKLDARRLAARKQKKVCCWSDLVLVLAHFDGLRLPVCVAFADWRDTQKAIHALDRVPKKQQSKEMSRRRGKASPRRS